LIALDSRANRRSSVITDIMQSSTVDAQTHVSKGRFLSILGGLFNTKKKIVSEQDGQNADIDNFFTNEDRTKAELAIKR